MADGLLDVVVLGDMNKIEFIQGLTMAYKGTLGKHPKMSTYKVEKIDIKPAESLFLQTDGELMGQAPTSFRVLPQTLRIAIYSTS